MSDVELTIAEDFEKVIRKHITWFPDLEEDDIFELSHSLVEAAGTISASIKERRDER